MFKVKSLSEDWASRAELPSHVVTMLNNFPSHLHPMSQLVAAVAALNSESKFAKVRIKGLFEVPSRTPGNQCPNLMNLSRGLNLPKTGFN